MQAMKSIQDPIVYQEIVQRINKLQLTNTRQWGKMDVAQMMAHCAHALEVSLGDRVSKQGLMGKLFGKLAKKSLAGDKPFRQGLPTAPDYVMADPKNFDAEKKRLTAAIKRLASPSAQGSIIHPFFGKMTPDELGVLNYKHLDHHLRQFGV